MSIATDIAIVAVVLAVGGGAAWKYNSVSDENEKLKARVQVLEPIVEAHVESGEIKNDQTEGIRKAESSSAKLYTDVARLRKSVEDLKKSSTDSLKTCNKSLTVAGEVFGECAERYTEVARKAELLQVDLQAMDKHAGLLEGIISDISGMEPLK